VPNKLWSSRSVSNSPSLANGCKLIIKVLGIERLLISFVLPLVVKPIPPQESVCYAVEQILSEILQTTLVVLGEIAEEKECIASPSEKVDRSYYVQVEHS